MAAPSMHTASTMPITTTRELDAIDLDARFVNFVNNTMREEPTWKYRYPALRNSCDTHKRNVLNHTVIEEELRFTRERFQKFLENKSGHWKVIAHYQQADKGLSARMVGFAVYRLPEKINPTFFSAEHIEEALKLMKGMTDDAFQYDRWVSSRTDGNDDRILEFERSKRHAKSVWFDRFEPNRKKLHLVTLGITDLCRHRGIALHELLNWGYSIATAENWIITAFADHIIRLGFWEYGFDELEELKIKVAFEHKWNKTAYVNLYVMLLDPHKRDRRRREYFAWKAKEEERVCHYKESLTEDSKSIETPRLKRNASDAMDVDDSDSMAGEAGSVGDRADSEPSKNIEVPPAMILTSDASNTAGPKVAHQKKDE